MGGWMTHGVLLWVPALGALGHSLSRGLQVCRALGHSWRKAKAGRSFGTAGRSDFPDIPPVSGDPVAFDSLLSH